MATALSIHPLIFLKGSEFVGPRRRDPLPPTTDFSTSNQGNNRDLNEVNTLLTLFGDTAADSGQGDMTNKSKPIPMSSLSPRAQKVLQTMGLKNMYDLIETWHESGSSAFLDTKDCGRKTMREIMSILELVDIPRVTKYDYERAKLLVAAYEKRHPSA